MPAQPKTPGIRDNHYCGSVGDFLKPHIQEGAHLSVVSAFFTIYAYAALKEQPVIKRNHPHDGGRS